MSNGQKRQELLEQGYIKVGSKTYCEYWKKDDDIITLYNDNDDAQRLEMEAMRKNKGLCSWLRRRVKKYQHKLGED